jgi:hypothetical protein
MRYLRICVSLLLSVSFIISCQKEKSYETDKTPARGSLHSNLDDECFPKDVKGIYLATTALTADNYIEVEVEVTSPGAYNISTDTVNGYSFKGSGNFATVGTNVIKLSGNGTPTAAGTNNFLITFDSTFCYVPVIVLPAGTGAATFTLATSGSSCINAVVLGNYSAGAPVNLANKVEIDVNVTKIGTYNISTTAVNGLVFSGSGVLTATGLQTIVLTASGTPSSAGNTVVTITVGASSCTFNVNVEDLSAFDYFPRTANSNWSYEYDDNDNDSLLRISIAQTVSINSNTYNVFIQTDDAVAGYDSSGYYRKSGSSYYEYIDIAGVIGLNDPVWIEYIFLKDDAAAGTSWTSASFSGTAPAPIGQVTLRMKVNIVEKDVAVTVNGTAYPNTIVVEQRFEINAGGTWVDSGIGMIKSYYSRDIGNIKQEVFDASGNSITKMELRRHEVY